MRLTALILVLANIAIFAMGVPALAAATEPSPSAGTESNHYSVNQDWEFYRPDDATTKSSMVAPDNTAWETVCLPHSVRLEPLNASGGRNYQGICWYRKTFTANPAWAGKTIYLHFEGAMQVADIWLNDKNLLSHYGGYLPFTVDLTGKLPLDGKPSTLLVRLDNSDNPEVPPGKAQSGTDFSYFGGLYRSVWLEVLNPVHISDEYLANRVAGGGIFVTYPEVSAAQATVAVQTEIQNDGSANQNCTVSQEIVGADGKPVASEAHTLTVHAGEWGTARQSLRVVSPLLWHPYHPHLYTLRTSVRAGSQLLDQRETRIGIRRFQFTQKGLFINDERFFTIGVNRHQDHPYVGYALPPSAQYRDALKLREAGFTSYRSHYPQDPSFMDACDKLGIIAIVSNPGWQFFGGKTFAERSYQNVREMVRRDRNHPSVMLWEPVLNESRYTPEFCRTVHELVHAEYPGDQCFTAGDDERGDGEHILDVLYAWRSGNKPRFGREWGDGVDNWADQQSRVRVDRAWGEMPMLVQAMTHLAKLEKTIKGNTTGGADLWAGIDCYRGYHHQPFYGGPLDLFRLPKFDYYMFQSQRPPEVVLPGVDSGPMVFIANFATPSSPANVTVFSNCEEVRLYQNGKLLATQKPDAGRSVPHPPFTFSTSGQDTDKTTYYMTNVESKPYVPAEYRAEGLIGGKVVAEHRVQSPGVMSQIQLTVDDCGQTLIADGADWVRVHACVCDKRGAVNPFSDDLITFSVEGPGSIIGDARIGANPVRPRFGIATVLVRAGTAPGRIRVRAEAFGLRVGETVIESRAAAGRKLNNAAQ
jgi:beta-galactosidase